MQPRCKTLGAKRREDARRLPTAPGGDEKVLPQTDGAGGEGGAPSRIRGPRPGGHPGDPERTGRAEGRIPKGGPEGTAGRGRAGGPEGGARGPRAANPGIGSAPPPPRAAIGAGPGGGPIKGAAGGGARSGLGQAAAMPGRAEPSGGRAAVPVPLPVAVAAAPSPASVRSALPERSARPGGAGLRAKGFAITDLLGLEAEQIGRAHV